MSAFEDLMKERDVSECVGDDYAWAQIVWNAAIAAALHIASRVSHECAVEGNPEARAATFEIWQEIRALKE